MNTREKHRKIRTEFTLKAKVLRDGDVRWLDPSSRATGELVTVRPFNAETTRKHRRSASWSHGFTHFEIKEWNGIGYCSISTFERLARKKESSRPKGP